jgi:hypothetical protein
VNADDAYVIDLVENLQREDLSPEEEADARRVREFYRTILTICPDDLTSADRFGFAGTVERSRDAGGYEAHAHGAY